MAREALLVIDVQERLFSAMDVDRRDQMISNIKILGATAKRLGVPILATEQYPKGLGHTLPELRAVLGDMAPFEKTSFSCCSAPGFVDRLRGVGADHAIVAGIEAHVCVLLTVLDLLTRGFRVSVVADAVCSRRAANCEIGLSQARQAGAVITATETIVFQLLGSADSDAFRELAKLLKP